MNEVVLRIVVSRANPEQCRVELFREGHGDDMVEQRADEVEEYVGELISGAVKSGRGEWIKKP